MLTLSKIAKELGVCKATVSLVLNGKAKENRISDATIEKISKYCAQRNYLPNIHASRMRQDVVKNIMVLLYMHNDTSCEESSFVDYNINRILEGITQKAEKEDYSITLRRFEENMAPQKIFNSFRNREVDGMICYGVDIPENWLTFLEQEKRRVVGIGVNPGRIPCVNIDNYGISKALTEHLLAKGKRDFFYLRGTEISYPGKERWRGFTETLRNAGVDFDPDSRSRKGDFRESCGREIAAELIACGKLPEVFVCANDKMAIGVMSALTAAGIKVPEQVMVAGGDNIALGRYIPPGLTSFDNCALELGRTACSLLLSLLHQDSAAGNITLESKLIIRGSTC